MTKRFSHEKLWLALSTRVSDCCCNLGGECSCPVRVIMTAAFLVTALGPMCRGASLKLEQLAHAFAMKDMKARWPMSFPSENSRVTTTVTY